MNEYAGNLESVTTFENSANEAFASCKAAVPLNCRVVNVFGYPIILALGDEIEYKYSCTIVYSTGGQIPELVNQVKS